MPRSPLPLLTALAMTLAGCARDAAAGDYPSLARRPAESQGFAEPATPPAPPLVADPALDARITALRARLDALAAGFDRDAAVAERAGVAAKGRAVGSEAWLTAQASLAELDDWRAQASPLASEADELARARAERAEPDYPLLATLRQAISAEARRQTAAIDRIAALTPPA